MATETLQAESACANPTTPESIFDQRFTAYRLAKAEMELHCARTPATDYDPQRQAEFDQLVNNHTDSMDSLLMTQCHDQRDLWRKIDVIVREEICDGWHLAAPIMALLRCDADDLLDKSREAPRAPLAAVN